MENQVTMWQLIALVISVVFIGYVFFDINGPQLEKENKPPTDIQQSTTPIAENNIEFDPSESVKIEPTKTNVFYIGVDNPLSVSIAGVPNNKLKVSLIGGKIQKGIGDGYNVHVTKPGTCEVSVSANGINGSKSFRIKRIPDPVARLNKKISGPIGVGEFKAQNGVQAFLDNFDYAAHCKIMGFYLEKISKNEPERTELVNRGARYTNDSKNLISTAKPGDIYIFDKVKAKCPGDPAGRLINSMVFKIK